MAHEANAGCMWILLICPPLLHNRGILWVQQVNTELLISQPRRCIFRGDFVIFPPLQLAAREQHRVKGFHAGCPTVQSWYLCLCTPMASLWTCSSCTKCKQRPTDHHQSTLFSHWLKKMQLSKQQCVKVNLCFHCGFKREPLLTCGFAFKANAPQVSTVSWIKHIVFVALFTKHKLLKTVCSLVLMETQSVMTTAAGTGGGKLLMCLFILFPALLRELKKQGDTLINL